MLSLSNYIKLSAELYNLIQNHTPIVKIASPSKRETMNVIKLQAIIIQSPFTTSIKLKTRLIHNPPTSNKAAHRRKRLTVKACSDGGQNQTERRSFLTLEEAGLVEISGLSSHERFLCRLTISSLNLLRVISEQEGCSIEELNAGKVCDWFLKDKLKREQDLDSAVLRWDESEFPM